MVVGPSDISGNKPLGPENSSPAADRVTGKNFRSEHGVLAEITVRNYPLLEKETNRSARYKIKSGRFPKHTAPSSYLLDEIGYQTQCNHIS